MYQRLKGFHLVIQAQFQLHIALSLVMQNLTVPQRILVMTLTTVDFQICHGNMSKKGGSSQVSQVFFWIPVYLFFVCVPGRVQRISHTFSIMY